jgi:hypothetical protein
MAVRLSALGSQLQYSECDNGDILLLRFMDILVRKKYFHVLALGGVRSRERETAVSVCQKPYNLRGDYKGKCLLGLTPYS